MAAMRFAFVVVVVLGCKREPAQQQPAPASAPVQPSPVAPSDAALGDAKSVDAAPLDAGGVELVLTEEGVRPIAAGTAFDQQAVAALLPGYTITVEEQYYEGTPDNRLIVSRGDTQLLELGGRSDKVAVVGVMSHEVRSEVGFAVGSKYDEVAKTAGTLSCEKPPHDDPYSSSVVCHGDSLPSFTLVFTPVKEPRPSKKDRDSDGFDIPAKQIPKVLKGAALDVVFVDY